MVNGLVKGGGFHDHLSHTPFSSGHRTESDARSELSSTPTLCAPNSNNLALHAATRTGEGNYVGGTHWASILEEIHDIRGIADAVLNMHPSPSPSSPSRHGGWTAEPADLMFGRREIITHEQAVARLPTEAQSERLVLLYFRNAFSTAPYIHTVKFKREYDAFWKDPRSVSLLWISCLASILWVGTSIALLKGENGLSDAPQLDELSALAVDCLLSGNYLSAQPYSIEALLLHGYTELRSKPQVDSSLWTKFGLTARLAQRMGYHRDPKYLPNVTPFEGEIRRRAWFFIEVFDVLFSFQQGVPPIIRDDECDTESPSNLFDADFDENVEKLPASRPPSEPTSALYLCIKSKLCRILRRVLRQTLSIKTPRYEDVLRLHHELEQYHSQIPAPLQIKPIQSYSFTDQTHDIMHRLMLEMMYQKSLCVLHRPYLNREKNNPDFEVSRRICREAALRILDLHAEYAEQSKPGGRMSEDKYMLSSLTIHDFLIASMILCLDLIENASTSSAKDRSRKLQALRTSYDIWSSKKAQSQEAAHATRIVGAILQKVSMAEAPRLPPPPSQGEIRGASIARLLNNDVQPPSPPRMPNPYDQFNLFPAIDFQLDRDVAPLDGILKEPCIVDWSVIDNILLDRPEITYHQMV
ncbi:hypothetical protein F5Y17DRAFT_427056 [Xylariaceae sp. FL0594]|nr:hypothetical protein F5Y17DRAFT_427056 [Xylariaceae sp. FL0594]